MEPAEVERTSLGRPSPLSHPLSLATQIQVAGDDLGDGEDEYGGRDTPRSSQPQEVPRRGR